jgi:hypothetical protein
VTASTNLPDQPLTDAEASLIDVWWRAANYFSVGQIYLGDNPLLSEPLKPEHVKPRLLGHWGTTPGLNFIYAHMNRIIRNWDLNAIYVIGPGHGGPTAVANAYWRTPIPRCTAKSPETRTAYANSSASSPLPAGSPRMSPQRPRARSTRGVSWATPCPTPTAPPSTTPTCWSAASSAMGRPRRPKRTAGRADTASNSLVVTHPFHPLSGQRLTVLYERRLAGIGHVLICDAGRRGTMALPPDYTDRAEPANPTALALDVRVLAALSVLLRSLQGR